MTFRTFVEVKPNRSAGFYMFSAEDLVLPEKTQPWDLLI